MWQTLWKPPSPLVWLNLSTHFEKVISNRSFWRWNVYRFLDESIHLSRRSVYLSVGPSVVRFMMLKNAYFCMKLTNFTMGRITMNSTRRVLGQLLVRSLVCSALLASLACSAALIRSLAPKLMGKCIILCLNIILL